MYIIDDICYAGSLSDDIKVTKLEPMQGRILLVTFSTGEKRLFDTTLLQGSAFKALEDEKIFNNPTLFHGVITWNDGTIDIAPETVYSLSYAYTSKDIAFSTSSQESRLQCKRHKVNHSGNDDNGGTGGGVELISQNQAAQS